ncbi:Cof-type HAD-IIB family hydrolase [Qiania dongpingensis]|uniref:HAD family phosphatase n=1 Tax=Qiania dongpingensis TaxID=2763669 RepID=A0A7G9G0Q0_9FIRM|nr:Cof-type HAD-IIB family hydrolase [Qiania dongpingensis]QNM04382.1 HAD family phosphatase [Qiania dongpingensis]
MAALTAPIYKAIFSEVDGALLSSSHKVGSLTREAIIQLQLHGVPFIFVSGRSPRTLESVDASIGLTAPYICYNGALILDQNKRVLKSFGFLPKRAISIKNYIKRCFPDISCFACSYDAWITDDPNDEWIRQEADIIQVPPIIKPLSYYLQKGQHVHKLLCMGELSLLDVLEDDLRVCFPELLIFKTKKHYLEIMSPEASASNAIRLVCGLYGIDPSETIAFGYNSRDMEMFRTVGLSIAMGNASELIKSAADRVTLDNDHDGIYHSLKKIFPIIH